MMEDYILSGAIEGETSSDTDASDFKNHAIHKHDRIRERELFRFYTPTNHDGKNRADTPMPSPNTAAGLKSDTPAPIKAGDTTLAALAQLVAHRLKVDRAMINLIGSETQYTIIDMAKTLELSEQKTCEIEGDEPWVGCGSSMSKSDSICTELVKLPVVDEERFLLIPDLRNHVVFKSRPYVCGKPYYRFYAGVTLKTASGIVIGALCALDSKPRQTLSSAEREFFSTTAKLIMEHFENKRAAVDRGKVTTMYDGLNRFVTGSSKQGKIKSEANEQARSVKTAQATVYGNQVELSGRCSEPDKVCTSSTEYVASCHAIPQADTPGDRRRDMFCDLSLGQQSRATFTRAANLLAESLGLKSGGVVFYDSFTSPQLAPESIPQLSSPQYTQMVWGDGVIESETAEATVLAEKLTGNLGSMSSYVGSPKVTTRMLAGLIEQYPGGHFWEFDDHGLLPAHEQERGSSKMSDTKAFAADEGAYLSSLFPGVRSLIFVPLFDTNAGSHYSGCFAWSNARTDRFETEVEFSFVKAFGNNVSAEVQQLVTLNADQAKSDFISSISHELRSPMHGILNAVEYLMGTRINSIQLDFLTTISNSTKTLLDTITHVLDFSRINQSSRRASKALAVNPDLDRESHDFCKLATAVNLATVTEQVVDSIMASTLSAKVIPSLEHVSPTTAARRKGDVQVSLDISAGNWLFRTEAGAIGRIVMNIFGNALKYTEHGSISVRLFQTDGEPHTENGEHGGRNVVLIVKDTGRGISPQYLKHGLFEPFTQECQLNEGTGLGMSIVLKTVKALHGDVIVNSTKGGGTEVQVFFRNLIGANKSDLTVFPSDDLRHLANLPEPLTVGLYGFDPGNQIGSLLHQYLRDWFHAKCVCDWTRYQNPHAIIVDHVEFSRMIKDLGDPEVEVIVLCDSPETFQKLQDRNGRCHYLYNTFGPQKLATKLRQCLDRLHPSNLMTFDRHGRSDPTDHSAPGTDAACSALLTPGDSASPARSTDNTLQTKTGDAACITRSLRPERPQLASLDTSTSSRSSLSTATSETGIRPTRVLVVDDSLINRTMVATVLRRKKMAVDEAVNGYLAVQATMTVDYDFIIMDINMPVMGGQEATREIRKREVQMGKKRQRMQPSVEDNRIAMQPFHHAAEPLSPNELDLADLASPPGSPEDAVMTDVEDDDDEEEEVATPSVSTRVNAAVIVASTAQNDPENRKAGLTNGFDIWLTKPYQTKGLVPMITGWMNSGVMDLSALDLPGGQAYK